MSVFSALSNIILVVIGILLFNLIVFMHELGHFLTAKSYGVKVNEFAIGMGPKILKIKKNETLYSIRLFPVGGFCAMKGDDEKNADPDSLNSKKPWQKFIIIAAGATMNMILGYILVFCLLSQKTSFGTNIVSNFEENSLSDKSGLQIGDKIIFVDNKKTRNYKDLNFNLVAYKRESFNLKVKRLNKVIDLENVKFANKMDFYVLAQKKTFSSLLKHTHLEVNSTIKMAWSSLIGMLTGEFSFREMSGPIGIVSVIGKAADEGLKTNFAVALNNIISIIAMITINLGIMNLLPIPALDGGRLIFILIEMVLGKPINPEYEGWIHLIGFFMLIAFMILMSFSDVLKFMGR
ncbi:MAG: site-2 protease family protein [Candidatus Paraimprobicoccus trichonymphae]|uniref:Site-2 protease family protein n=1 Tax=Candidatus Paraimprobicoccus trichonymphae TaxID=3033793 RepID=A0AA48HZQ3_9FIRM|nr:MAG: site-2 protease family protein [Candidatus Paraimprobicoccus trichonymphae]